jgi:hypothetical protein
MAESRRMLTCRVAETLSASDPSRRDDQEPDYTLSHPTPPPSVWLAIDHRTLSLRHESSSPSVPSALVTCRQPVCLTPQGGSLW